MSLLPRRALERVIRELRVPTAGWRHFLPVTYLTIGVLQTARVDKYYSHAQEGADS